MTEPEPLSGPDQLMHLELLIAELKHCQETGQPFVLDDTHPLKQHIRATARQRAWAIIRRPLPDDLADEIAFRRIVANFEETQ